MKAPYDIFDYPSYWKGREYEDQVDKLAVKKLIKKTGKKGNLIDIGGGFGRLASFLASDFNQILLVDQSEILLKEAGKRLKKFKNIKLKKGNCLKLPAKKETFDIALIVRVIHHLEDPEKAFSEAYRVLKPGGFFILEFANKIHFLARIKAFLKGDLNFCQSLKPAEKRSQEAIKKKMIVFCNHHPKKIQQTLEKQGFQIVEKLSTSNCRFSILKKVLPISFLLKIESLLQPCLAKIYFGPSIYFLAKKPKKP